MGEFFKIEEDIIHHNHLTQNGVSGAAIFAQHSNGHYTICGIHTHKVPSTLHRMGLYFSQ
jgi:hypothetical protein